MALLYSVYYVARVDAPPTMREVDHHVVVAASADDARTLARTEGKAEPGDAYSVEPLAVVAAGLDATPRIVLTRWYGNPAAPDTESSAG